jgi:LAO/AO transport system kinase
VARATKAAAEYQGALNILTPLSPSWTPPVVTVSARDNRGLEELWARIEAHRGIMTATGEHEARRRRQAVTWMRDLLAERLMDLVRAEPRVARRLEALESEVREGRLTATRAVEELIGLIGAGKEGR